MEKFRLPLKVDCVLQLFFVYFLMMVQLNIFVWNYRGAGKRSFVSMMKDLRRKYEFSILILLETRISGERADKVI